MIRVGIVGATGYAGEELIRLLLGHEKALITKLVSRTFVGQFMEDVYPSYFGYDLPRFEKASKVELASECDVVFFASPSGTAWPWIRDLISINPRIKIIDIGSDLRLKDPLLYKEWYGYEHGAPELLLKSVYGLTELNFEKITNAGLVANPGCYPTAVILAFAPLLHFGLIGVDSIIVNALTGISGAGRALSQGYHFPECNENMKAYGLLRHRHVPEIEQELNIIGKAIGRDEPVCLSFTPHVVPLNRGILITGYGDFRWDKAKVSDLNIKPDTLGLTQLYKDFYHGKKFIRIRPADQVPQTKAVAGSNYCDISIRADERTERILVMSAIDNLVKGAAGQAVQNMNLMFGEPEDTGLNLAPLWL